MTAPLVQLTIDQITMLRNALNLAAEYSARIDDPQHYDDHDWQIINARIDSFRALDAYLRSFEPQADLDHFIGKEEQLTMRRIENGYERTSCSCEKCVRNCQLMPGFLIPSDLERMIPPGVVPTAWAEGRLLASPGAIAKKAGHIFRIRTLVPAVKADGSCIHLNAEQRCEIHAIAPFGCAFFDCQAERGNLSHYGLIAVIEAWQNNGLYARIWRHLSSEGHEQLGPEILRQRFQHEKEDK